MANISISYYHLLCQHCTFELISLFDNLCIIDIDEEDNSWNVEEFINSNNTVSLFDTLKLLFIFEQIGGFLYKEKKPIQFSILLRDIDNIQYTDITTYWYNNEANGIMPIYNVGQLDVPKILPLFATIQQEEGKWSVARLFKGAYKPLKGEIYPNELTAKERAEELNQNIYQ